MFASMVVESFVMSNLLVSDEVVPNEVLVVIERI